MNAILEYILMLVYWIVSFLFFMLIFREKQFKYIIYTLANTLYTAVPSDITDVNDPN